MRDRSARPLLQLVHEKTSFSSLLHCLLSATDFRSPLPISRSQILQLLCIERTRQDPGDLECPIDLIHRSLDETHREGPHDEHFHLIEGDMDTGREFLEGQSPFVRTFAKGGADQREEGEFFLHG
jgi:hypothetical protein